MRMLACLLLCGLALSQTAGAFDPADTYTEAFLLIQEAEQAEQRADWATAAARLRSAAELLSSIKRSAPDWKPALVEYRQAYCRERLAVIQKKLPAAAPAPAPPAPPTPPVAPPTPTAPAAQPTEAAAVAPPLQAEFSAQPLAELRRQNEDLQRQLAHAQRQIVDLQTLVARGGFGRPSADETELRRLRNELAAAQATARQVPILQARVDELSRENARLSAQLATAVAAAPAADTAELQRLREELAAVREAAAARTAQLEKENAELKLLIATAEQKAATAAPSPPTAPESEELRRLRQELADARAQADAARRAAQQLGELQRENEQLRAQLAAATTSRTPVPARVEPSETRRLRAELAELREAIATNARLTQRLREENAYLRNLLEQYVNTIPELKGKLGKYGRSGER